MPKLVKASWVGRVFPIFSVQLASDWSRQVVSGRFLLAWALWPLGRPRWGPDSAEFPAHPGVGRGVSDQQLVFLVERQSIGRASRWLHFGFDGFDGYQFEPVFGPNVRS